MEKENVDWRIIIDGLSTRDQARKIASLLRRAAKDNVEEDVRIEIVGYTDRESM